MTLVYSFSYATVVVASFATVAAAVTLSVPVEFSFVSLDAGFETVYSTFTVLPSGVVRFSVTVYSPTSRSLSVRVYLSPSFTNL